MQTETNYYLTSLNYLTFLIKKMNIKKTLSTIAAMCFVALACATDIVPITPRPVSAILQTGSYVVPKNYTVACGTLADSIKLEAEHFVKNFNAAANFDGKVTTEGNGNITLNQTDTTGIGLEGYKLMITANGITIQASTTAGFFYGFQSLKFLLPLNVMAGVKDANVKEYSTPLVSITDRPRFGYRGFMLDVSRHFFSVEEVKRMLDVMSYYKMNRFHWHLTDDQGWRIEIKKYPKLTKVGSISPTVWNVDFKYGRYNTYAPYGPYFYTQEEAKDVVAYAKERHIEIVPEVDMPGHICSAMAAYPEFSCTPNGSHQVQTTGGIYADVLNVANPKAVEFAEDVLDELTDIFPYPSIHIGGDECPTSAWQNNTECKAMADSLNLGTNFRALQSHFIKTLADHVANKNDVTKCRRLMAWNESISASGADTELISSANPTIVCWEPCDASALKAAQLGLDNIVTPYGPYYINRKQSTDAEEPYGAGSGSDNLERTYAYVPVPTSVSASLTSHYKGVQGTFWTEHVSSNDLLEYLALPRLAAVAETGWTPQALKDFEHFRQRITHDSTLYNYNGYLYGKHYMKAASTAVVPPTSGRWYKLVTRNTTDTYRMGKCIELLRDGSPIIGTGNAKVGRLWSATVAAESDDAYNYQLWTFKESPSNAGHFAMVCKAKPNGSVNPTATAQNNTGRWDYDEQNVFYDFILGDNSFSTYGENYCYSIRSDKSSSNLWMNMAAAGQNYSINQYGNPSDGNSGIWEFRPVSSSMAETLQKEIKQATLLLKQKTYTDESDKHPGRYGKAEAAALQTALAAIGNIDNMTDTELSAAEANLSKYISAMNKSLAIPEMGKTYRMDNTIERFSGVKLCDVGANTLRATNDEWADDVWAVTSSQAGDEGVTLQLKNVQTGKYWSGASSPISLGTTAGSYVATFQDDLGDFTLSANGKALFPISTAYATDAGCVYSDGIRPQGTGWSIDEAYVMTYIAKDEDGTSLGTYRQSALKGASYTANAPTIKNYDLVGYEGSANGQTPSIASVNAAQVFNVTYRRNSYSITYQCYDQNGILLGKKEDIASRGNDYTIHYPEFGYCNQNTSSWTGGSTFIPTTDITIRTTYVTSATEGFREVNDIVTTLEDGHYYLFYDATTASGRSGFINESFPVRLINTSTVDSGSPSFVWQLVKSGNGYKVKAYDGTFIPSLEKSSVITTSNAGDTFTFALNADGSTWSIKGSNGIYWNGETGRFTGWSDAHPYRIYDFVAEPYFVINYVCRLADGTTVGQGSYSQYVKAGDEYKLTAPVVSRVYPYTTCACDDEQSGTMQHDINATYTYYTSDPTSIVDIKNVNKAIPAVTYDLSGRKVIKHGKGVYIEAGKKIMKR